MNILDLGWAETKKDFDSIRLDLLKCYNEGYRKWTKDTYEQFLDMVEYEEKKRGIVRDDGEDN